MWKCTVCKLESDTRPSCCPRCGSKSFAFFGVPHQANGSGANVPAQAAANPPAATEKYGDGTVWLFVVALLVVFKFAPFIVDDGSAKSYCDWCIPGVAALVQMPFSWLNLEMLLYLFVWLGPFGSLALLMGGDTSATRFANFALVGLVWLFVMKFAVEPGGDMIDGMGRGTFTYLGLCLWGLYIAEDSKGPAASA